MHLSHAQIHYILDQYLSLYPHEQERLTPLFDFLETTQGDLYDRKNMDGHIVWSGIIVDEEKKESLMIYHNTFQRYQQPWWHIDPGETPVQWAQRECIEETGITKLEYIPAHRIYTDMPIDIWCHIVPENEQKKEWEHWHFNFIYVFEAKEKNTQLNDEGVSDAKWVDLDEVGKLLPSIPYKVKELD